MSKKKEEKVLNENEEIKEETSSTCDENTTNEKEEVKEETSEAKEESPEVKEETPKNENSDNDKYVRLYADYQNLKKRFEKEKSDIYLYANEKIVLDILGVIDNFERAFQVDTKDEAFKDGMGLILKQLNEALKKAGVSEIEALGKEFDPNFHSAVMMEDSTEFESNHVTFVIQKGYTLNGKVIRPSMVKVAN